MFLDFLDSAKFLNVSSALPLLYPTISLLSALNAFEANNPDDSVVFDIKVRGVVILETIATTTINLIIFNRNCY